MTNPEIEAPKATAKVKKTVVRNTALNTVAQFTAMAMYFLLMPLIITSVGTAQFGLYVLVQSVVGYFGILDMSAATALTKHVAQFTVGNEHQKLREAIAGAFIFYLGVGILIAITLLMLGTFFIYVFKLPPSIHILARQILYVSAAFVLLSWPLATFRSVLAGLQRYDLTSGIGIFVSVATTVLAIFALRAGSGLLVLVVLEAAVSITGLLILTVLAVRILGFVPLHPKDISRQTAYSLAGFSLGALIVQMGKQILEKSDVIVLGMYMPISVLAFYEAANKLQALPLRLSRLVGSAIIPAASALQSTKSTAVLRDLYLRGSKYAAAVTLAATLSLLLLTKPLLTFWLGSEFSRATFPARVFLLFWLFYAVIGLTGVVLIGVGHIKPLSALTVAKSLLNIVISVYLVTRIGLLGVILGTVIAELIAVPVVLGLTLRFLDIRFSLFLKRVVAKVYPPLIFVGLAGWYLTGLREPENLLQVAGYALAINFAYLFAFYLSGTDREEKRDLNSALLIPVLNIFSNLAARKRNVETDPNW